MCIFLKTFEKKQTNCFLGWFSIFLSLIFFFKKLTYFLYIYNETTLFYFNWIRIFNANDANLFLLNVFVLILVFYLVYTKPSVSFLFLINFLKKTLFLFLLSYACLYPLTTFSFEKNFFFKETVNFALINSLVSIHPWLAQITYALFILVMFMSVFLRKLNLTWCGLYFYNTYVFIKFVVATALLVFCLGSWWASQELNWNSWWNWDVVELVSVVLITLGLFLIHVYKLHRQISINFWLNTACWFFIGFCILIVRYDIFNSIHAFNFFHLFELFFYIPVIVFCYLWWLSCKKEKLNRINFTNNLKRVLNFNLIVYNGIFFYFTVNIIIIVILTFFTNFNIVADTIDFLILFNFFLKLIFIFLQNLIFYKNLKNKLNTFVSYLLMLFRFSILELFLILNNINLIKSFRFQVVFLLHFCTFIFFTYIIITEYNNVLIIKSTLSLLNSNVTALFAEWYVSNTKELTYKLSCGFSLLNEATFTYFSFADFFKKIFETEIFSVNAEEFSKNLANTPWHNYSISMLNPILTDTTSNILLKKNYFNSVSNSDGINTYVKTLPGVLILFSLIIFSCFWFLKKLKKKNFWEKNI